MGILSSKKTVVGLFSSGVDVEEAIKRLQAHGFYDNDNGEVTVIDEAYLAENITDTPDTDVVAVPSSGSGSPAHPLIAYPLAPDEAQTGYSITRVKDILTDAGIPDEEAAQLAQQAIRGNSLIIVHTDEERAREALRIMEQVNARVSLV